MVKSLSLLASLPALLLMSGQAGPNIGAEHKSAFEIHREHAVEMNALAGHLESQDDARRLVGTIADMFSDDLPRELSHGRFLDRVAAAEYASAQNPARRLSEQAIADAWNTFAREIGAGPETRVTAAEIHAERESFLWTSRMIWRPGRETIWVMPNIYATRPDGTMDANCRMLEVYRIVWDLANMPENLRGTRERLAKGITLADMDASARRPQSGPEQSQVVARISAPNPIRMAEVQYIRGHGERKMRRAIQKLSLDLLQAQDAR